MPEATPTEPAYAKDFDTESPGGVLVRNKGNKNNIATGGSVNFYGSHPGSVATGEAVRIPVTDIPTPELPPETPPVTPEPAAEPPVTAEPEPTTPEEPPAYLAEALAKLAEMSDKITEMAEKIAELTAKVEALENPTTPDPEGPEGPEEPEEPVHEPEEETEETPDANIEALDAAVATSKREVTKRRTDLIKVTIRRQARAGDGLTQNRKDDEQIYQLALSEYVHAVAEYEAALRARLQAPDPADPDKPSLSEVEVAQRLKAMKFAEVRRFMKAKNRLNNKQLEEAANQGEGVLGKIWAKRITLIHKWADVSTKKKLMIGLATGVATGIAAGPLGLGLAAVITGGAAKMSLGLFSRKASAVNVSKRSLERELGNIDRAERASRLKELESLETEADAEAATVATEENFIRNLIDGEVRFAQRRNKIGNFVMLAGGVSSAQGVAELAGTPTVHEYIDHVYNWIREHTGLGGDHAGSSGTTTSGGATGTEVTGGGSTPPTTTTGGSGYPGGSETSPGTVTTGGGPGYPGTGETPPSGGHGTGSGGTIRGNGSGGETPSGTGNGSETASGTGGAGHGGNTGLEGAGQGIANGAQSGVEIGTENGHHIVLESANFHPDSFYGHNEDQAMNNMLKIFERNGYEIHGNSEAARHALAELLKTKDFPIAYGTNADGSQHLLSAAQGFANGTTANANASGLEGLPIVNGSSVESWNILANQIMPRAGITLTKG